ncbi:MAG TPA: ATP-dependent RecD-like DNA helicase [Gemmataceae bacterium]|nr:ATP-dependent RecD-like DNA helicase [Gemmataceae bacterium]
MAETLTGVIERITFHNLDTGFAVLRVLADDRRGQVTVVGHLPNVNAGEFIEASGEWVQNRDFGIQFKAENLRTTPPGTVEGIKRYLGSGLVKGIGKHYARKIVEVFGERTLSVIDESPTFLSEVKGIGPKRIQQIKESWQQQKAVRSIMVFLQSYGIGTARAVRIYKTYGDRAIETIRENPYRLAEEIWGIGFQTADKLSLQLGMDRQSPQRAHAALLHALREFSEQGHVGFPEVAVIEKTAEMTQISTTTIQQAIEQAREQDEIVRDNAEAASGGREKPVRADETSWLYLKPLFLAEVGVARQIRQLNAGPHPLPAIEIEKALTWIEQRMKLALAESQKAAIRAAATKKLMVLTGGPGTGKTTIVRGILDIFSAKGMRCGLCAPTGRAAKRLGESTCRPSESKTIHRLLEFDPALGQFKRHRENPLDVDLLVVDEASMVDIVLMNQLLRAVPQEACVLFVGDIDQLPSVGPGTVLGDLIESKVVPVVRLTEIFRQAEQSRIIRAAHAVNHGDEPEASPDSSGDFFFIECEEPEAILDTIIRMVKERIPQRFRLDPFRDVQILTPVNKTVLGVSNLNQKMQEILNPAGPGKKELLRDCATFRVADKVMQTKNNYQKEVFNGDIGLIRKIEPVDQEVLVDFDGREVSYDFNEMDELTLAYACTIHKSQGGEYVAVVIPLHTQHFMMLQRNLLYTAITRGRRLVVIVGSKKALSLTVRRQETAKRFSLLRQRLQYGVREAAEESSE